MSLEALILIYQSDTFLSLTLTLTIMSTIMIGCSYYTTVDRNKDWTIRLL